MRKPKHIREANKQRLQETVAANKANLRMIKAESHVAIGVSNGRSFSTGYRMSPSPTVSHKFSEHPGKGAGTRADKITSYASIFSNVFRLGNADSQLTDKQRRAKYRTKDNEHYTQPPAGKDTLDNRCMVKVGMTKEHYVPMVNKETGETRVVKVPAKPKYKEVGTA